MGCTGRCLEQRTTSASPNEVDGELRRGRAVMVAVVMVYNVHVLCSLPTKDGASSMRPGLYRKSYSYKDNFITFVNSIFLVIFAKLYMQLNNCL